MEKPATDIYSFDELRRKGFTYVDKTAQILPLVDNSVGKQFFLARPRRFGKSLLVSTMHALFEVPPDDCRVVAVHEILDRPFVLLLEVKSCHLQRHHTSSSFASSSLHITLSPDGFNGGCC